MASRDDELPSWDEFGAEQLDYGEDENDGGGGAPGDDPGDPGDGPSCSSSSSSSAVQLPSAAAPPAVPSSSAALAARPAAPVAAAAAAAERDIGPSLPPGFELGGGSADDDDEDPEDPGEPEEAAAALLPAAPAAAAGGQPEDADLMAPPSLPSVGPSLPIDEPAPAPAASSSSSSSSSSSFARRASSSSSAIPPVPALRATLGAGSSSSSSYGPAAPPPPPPEPQPVVAPVAVTAPAAASRVIGPAFPPDLLPFEANGGDDIEEEEEEEEEEDQFGPALPPGMNGGGGAARGPAAAAAAAGDGPEMEMPTMDEEDDDDDDMVGPMPARADGSEERAAEARRERMRLAKEAEDKKLKREEWMLQLPKKLNSYGLGARSFSKSNGSGEGSDEWTTGPGGSKQEQPGEAKKAMEQLATAERDYHQAQIASTLNANRNESMLDSHAKKRKVATEKEEEVAGPSVRRPFDIEKDMQVRGLKPSSSTAEIKEKCGHLGSRFGNSGSAKYL